MWKCGMGRGVTNGVFLNLVRCGKLNTIFIKKTITYITDICDIGGGVVVHPFKETRNEQNYKID